mmetsp:Transcript_22310/g.30450  ORF Transcript_22310/g.30450 Transcript_22310/m.30450 type:complete len:162 (-) Transcript_22310:432-917(-)|eukprot:CAMPEP_0185770298 /NCGR_PEP_ID=MMETSP1174-20130828/58491_1 /TAXON_ID=35687 /ORGANISM="Dictyocha speculum, Strain CCMP1381" /LENGTH=161 /DNA_ID=CAMNT_0028455677 /DNA_START=38 /DNA_END=523 /DNA_ORIENTATION=+
MVKQNREADAPRVVSLASFANAKNTTFARNRADAIKRRKKYKQAEQIRDFRRKYGKAHAQSTGIESGIQSQEGMTTSSNQQKRKKHQADPFYREKVEAQAAKKVVEEAVAQKAEAARQLEKKIHHRKKMHKSHAQRDKRGRPRVRNTIDRILGVLTSDKNK